VKYIRHLYLTSCIAVLLLCAGFFYAWNGNFYTSAMEPNNLSKGNIDMCLIGDDVIEVRGWAYLPATGRVLNSIYAETLDGEMLSLPATAYHIISVQKDLLLTDYEMPGFHALKRNLQKISFTGNIIVVSKSENGGVGVIKFKC